MRLKPQDIVVLLKLIIIGSADWSFASLAADLSISASEVHAGVKRAISARLFDEVRNVPIRKNIQEFVVHGLKYAFPPMYGSLTRGIPTGYAAEPLKSMVVYNEAEVPPVWPHPEGEARGYEIAPLYKTVPNAALKDPRLYELLALIDGIRDGRVRERTLAINELSIRLAG